jgi:hypothetical protein
MEFKKQGTRIPQLVQCRAMVLPIEIKILGNQRPMYELVMTLITETSLVKFCVITMQQNFIPLPTYVLHFRDLIY